MRHAVRFLSVVALAAASLALPGPAPARPVAELSANWAGYVALGRGLGTVASFRGVTATWRQPQVRCGVPNAGAASAFWVGLGGFAGSSAKLQQTGTVADCDARGKPVHYAWWEVLPAPSIRMPLRVRAGDLITATVDVNAAGTWVRMRVRNRTTGAAFVKGFRVRGVDATSAEWIVEAPSLCSGSRCRVVPLANFGSVRFTQASAALGGHRGRVSDAAWLSTAIHLVPTLTDELLPDGVTGNRSTAGASPGPLAAGGSAFRVTWKANAGYALRTELGYDQPLTAISTSALAGARNR